MTLAATLAAWHAADLRAATSWIFALDDRARRDLLQAVRKVRDPDKSVFDYRRADCSRATCRFSTIT
jgi:hypothetical protein